MKILFLGDSITEGVGASCRQKNYVSLVGEKLGAEVENYGISGTRIARQKKATFECLVFDYSFLFRVELLNKNADKVFVFGGTNDFGHGDAEFGELFSKDEFTFCGAVNSLVDKLTARFEKEKICFLIPTRRFEENIQGKRPLSDYVNAIKTILEKHNINYIDLYNKAFPKPVDNLGDEFTADGLHPNDKGHELIADIIVDYIKNNK